MTLDESLNFFATQIGRAERGLESATLTKNVQLAALNFRQMFKGHLMRGLIKWRGKESPINELTTAMRLATDASLLLKSWDSSLDIASCLPLERAVLLAVLLDKPVISDVLGKLGQKAGTAGLDYLLATANMNEVTAREVGSLLKRLSSEKRTNLAAKTYQNYFNIMLSANDTSGKINEMVENGAQLFEARARDSYFSGGDQTEGGGADNARVVDYRLAVAMKRAGYQCSSAHAWIW